MLYTTVCVYCVFVRVVLYWVCVSTLANLHAHICVVCVRVPARVCVCMYVYVCVALPANGLV